MICPSCKTENNEGAKFCKKCGAPLEGKTINHESMINSMSKDKSDNTTKIIIVALIIVVVVLAAAFIYLQSSGHEDSQAKSASASQNSSSSSSNSQPNATVQPSTTAQPDKTAKTPSSLRILGGSFSTGSADSDKTYARINLGTQNAGKDVIVQIWYSRDGNTLNHGNMVPVTVHSDGYVELSSADAYKYYPDYATINVYDSNSNLLATQSVSLSPTSGTQTF